MWPASCSSSCFSSTSRKRNVPDRDVEPSSRMLGKAASRWHLPVRTVMPRSSSRPSDLVHHCRTSHDPAFTHPMQRLHIQLLVGLDRHKAHRGPAHCFGDRFGVDEIVLVGLHERLYILCRHQPRLMALLAQSLAEEMRACTGFHPNQIDLARSQ